MYSSYGNGLADVGIENRVGRADLFWDELDPFFKSIDKLDRPPRPIRIAVLDSGVDKTDRQILRNIEKTGRIRPWKTFVESPADEDSCGHGTFVTKLLLRAAPAAHIYMAKICETKNINAKFMPGIAKVSFSEPLVGGALAFSEETLILTRSCLGNRLGDKRGHRR